MRSGDSFVVVVDFDVSGILEKLVGTEPAKLAAYMKGLQVMAIKQFERSSPDSYEPRGELHRAVWLKQDRNISDLAASIFALFSSLVCETERANKCHRKKGLPPASFHGGLSEGSVDIGSSGASGEGANRACSSAEHARKTNALLMVTADVLKNVPSELLQGLGISLSSQSPSDYVVIQHSVLERLSRTRKRRRLLSFLGR